MSNKEYVDMGLPSGRKWATCNVGASKPEKYGSYFSWGEIEPKEKYDCNSITLEKEMQDISGNPAYDVAKAQWGGNWRMPTKEDFEELETHCKFKVVYKNIFAKLLKISSQIKGVKVISKTNGNSIFLPAAGEYGSLYNKKKPYQRGKSCYYWSSTPDLEEEGNVSAYCFFLSS